MRISILTYCLLALLFSLPTLQAQESTKELKALLITGGCCHDYPAQTKIITEEMSARTPISWTVHRYDEDRNRQAPIYKEKNWSEGYDLILHNECFGGVTDVPFVESIVTEHLRTKVPAVVIHCSMHSYRNAETDAWRKLIGVRSMRHEKAKRSLDVIVRETNHSIVAGIPAKWTTPTDELYIIEKTWPEVTVIATAYSTEEEADQPVIWTNHFEGVRVFGITLGHANETMQQKEWLEVVHRGLLWSLDRLPPPAK